MPDKRTSADIVDICNTVLDAKAAGKHTFSIGGSTFDFSDVGLCQKNARLVYEAATGEPMPGKADCAGATFANIDYFVTRGSLKILWSTKQAWDKVVTSLKPGDFLYFGGGKMHGCGHNVGHVGIWLGLKDGVEQMFQNTSRKVNGVTLGTTRVGPTQDQKDRFLGAFRFLPLVGTPATPPPPTKQEWQFKPEKDSAGDITCTGVATQFNDHVTRTGIPADRADLQGCSLPRGLCAATKYSGFDGVPDKALVRIYCEKTKRTAWAVVIDEGPAWIAKAGTGSPGAAMIDLTPGTAEALGLVGGENATVKIRVFSGSEQVVQQGQKGFWAPA